MKKKLFGLALALGISAVGAQESYSTWTYHRNVILNTTISGAAIGSDAINFPVLVRLGAADSAIFKQVLPGAADLRFTKANDTTRLKYQIDTWDSAGKKAALWVLVDTVKGNNKTQKIRLHWGKTGVSDSSNGNAVFSNGFTNVWHLGNAAGTAARPNSITGGNNAVPTNFPGGYSAPAGIIGKGEYLRGGPGYSAGAPNAAVNNDYFNLGTIATNYSQGLTFSVWVNQEIVGNNQVFYTSSETPNGLSTSGLIVIGIQGNDGNAGAKFRQRNTGAGGNSGILSTGSELLGIQGSWAHIVASLNVDGDMNYYVNGLLVNGVSGVSQYSNASRVVNQLGTTLASMQYTDTSFHGGMDEARLANVGRTADWVSLEYQNQKEAQTLVVFDSIPVALSRSHGRLSSNLLTQVSGRGVTFQLPGLRSGSAVLSITDMHGREVWSKAFAAGSNRLNWDATRASAGVYMATVKTTDIHGQSRMLQAKVPLTR